MPRGLRAERDGTLANLLGVTGTSRPAAQPVELPYPKSPEPQTLSQAETGIPVIILGGNNFWNPAFSPVEEAILHSQRQRIKGLVFKAWDCLAIGIAGFALQGLLDTLEARTRTHWPVVIIKSF